MCLCVPDSNICDKWEKSTRSNKSIQMLNWKHAHCQVKVCTCSSESTHMLNWRNSHAQVKVSICSKKLCISKDKWKSTPLIKWKGGWHSHPNELVLLFITESGIGRGKKHTLKLKLSCGVESQWQHWCIFESLSGSASKNRNETKVCAHAHGCWEFFTSTSQHSSSICNCSTLHNEKRLPGTNLG